MVSFHWDNNGNLIDDGVNNYTYDHANRLTSVSDQSSVSPAVERGAGSYQHNGLGNRLQQTVDEVTTTYMNDLNAGLTQVLSDGTNTYLYGNGRLAQDDGVNMGYFLGDALGSVRQLTDASGSVTLTQSYEPYGEVLSNEGTGTSIYGFDAELTDSYIKLINLRSRLYDPCAFVSIPYRPPPPAERAGQRGK